ncbi:uncharacterized protein LOC135104952 isoform X2 [Scylla paramamosain]|uniref:uncharacterized protein LOC135104952 isoform X2 n=1 Tax=Scylla paramamosain TaxID=85552 RepID=UPI0030832C8D
MRVSVVLMWVALVWVAGCVVSAEPEAEPQPDALADPDPGRERRQLSVTNALRLVMPSVRHAARRLTQEVAPAVGSTILKAGNHLALRAAEGLQDTVQVVNQHLVPAIEDHLVQATNAAVPYINRGIDALGVGIQQGAEVVSRSAAKGVDQIGRRVLGRRRHHRVKKIANNLKGSITSSLNTIAGAITHLTSPDQLYTNNDYHNSHDYRDYHDYRDNYYYDYSTNNHDYYTRPDDYPTYRPDRGGDASVPGSKVRTVGQALARVVDNTAYSLSSSVLGQNLTRAVAPLAKSVSKTMSESLPAVSFDDGRIVIDLPGTDNSERTEAPPRSCTTPEGKKGVCQDLGDCPNLILDLTNLRKSVCFKRLFVPGVCCPSEGSSVDDDRFPNTRPTTTTITTRRPPPITAPTQRPTPVPSVPSITEPPIPSRNFQCGVPQVPEFRVVGGKESGRGQWPWMAAVWLHGPKKTEFWCGATLISRRHILTAAHCTKDSRGKTFNPQQFTVRLGDHNIFSTSDDFISKPKTYRVSHITPHPDFKAHGFYNDVAVLKLAEDVEFTEYILPVCLPSDEYRRRPLDHLVGHTPSVIGWGSTHYGGQESAVLREAKLPVWKNSDCNDAYFQPITEIFLCAGYVEGGRDACQGDSGGPLLLFVSGRWVQIGLVSFGNRCAEPGYPGVYTRIAHFMPWIVQNMF